MDIKRIEMQDTKNSCAIRLDHTNRKLICRLWFNQAHILLGLIDEQKGEERVPLVNIYECEDRLRAIVGIL